MKVAPFLCFCNRPMDDEVNAVPSSTPPAQNQTYLRNCNPVMSGPFSEEDDTKSKGLNSTSKRSQTLFRVAKNSQSCKNTAASSESRPVDEGSCAVSQLTP